MTLTSDRVLVKITNSRAYPNAFRCEFHQENPDSTAEQIIWAQNWYMLRDRIIKSNFSTMVEDLLKTFNEVHILWGTDEV